MWQKSEVYKLSSSNQLDSHIGLSHFKRAIQLTKWQEAGRDIRDPQVSL